MLLGLCLISVSQACKVTLTNTQKLEIMTKQKKDSTPIRGLVISKHGYDHKKFKNTVFTQPSKTIVGESYTIQELLRKHTTGLMPQIGKEPVWQEDATFDSIDMQKLNNADIDVKRQLGKELKYEIEEKENEILEKKRQKKEAQEQKTASENAVKTTQKKAIDDSKKEA